jgi:hypothetical protein
MRTETLSSASGALVGAAGEIVHVEHLDRQTSSAQERDVVVLDDRADHALGPEAWIGADCSDTGTRRAISEVCSRPPGSRTRAISPNAAGLSGTRFSTPLLVTTLMLASGSGMCPAFPSITRTCPIVAILAFAERVLPRASDLWVQASLDYRQRLQQLFFPEGIAFDGIRFNRTAVTAPLSTTWRRIRVLKKVW